MTSVWWQCYRSLCWYYYFMSIPSSMFTDSTVAAWNWPLRECLHHRGTCSGSSFFFFFFSETQHTTVFVSRLHSKLVQGLSNIETNSHTELWKTKLLTFVTLLIRHGMHQCGMSQSRVLSLKEEVQQEFPG